MEGACWIDCNNELWIKKVLLMWILLSSTSCLVLFACYSSIFPFAGYLCTEKLKSLSCAWCVPFLSLFSLTIIKEVMTGKVWSQQHHCQELKHRWAKKKPLYVSVRIKAKLLIEVWMNLEFLNAYDIKMGISRAIFFLEYLQDRMGSDFAIVLLQWYLLSNVHSKISHFMQLSSLAIFASLKT